MYYYSRRTWNWIIKEPYQLKEGEKETNNYNWKFQKLNSMTLNKRKNLEFQMLAAVYHKGDHGQYCYTLK